MEEAVTIIVIFLLAKKMQDLSFKIFKNEQIQKMFELAIEASILGI